MTSEGVNGGCIAGRCGGFAAERLCDVVNVGSRGGSVVEEGGMEVWVVT